MSSKNNENLQLTTVNIPNKVIQAKYKSSIYEEQIMWLSMAHIKDATFKTITSESTGVKNKLLTLDLQVKEFANLAGKELKHYYTQIARAVPGAGKLQLAIKHKDGNHVTYEYQQFFDNVKYNEGNGSITVRFAPGILDYINSRTGGFTPLALKVLFSFNKVWTSRLYTILRSNCYDRKYDDTVKQKDGSYRIPYNLSDLKLMLGIIDPSDSAVERELKSKDPDYEAAIASASPKNILYPTWADFKRSVIDPSVQEINKGTDIYVSYEAVGKPISTIYFNIKLINTDEDMLKKDNIDENRIAAMFLAQLYREGIEEFSWEQIQEFVVVSDYDLDKLTRSGKYLIQQIKRGSIIEDKYKYLLRTIQEDWGYQEPNVVADIDTDEEIIDRKEYCEKILNILFDYDILISSGEEDIIVEYIISENISLEIIEDIIKKMSDTEKENIKDSESFIYCIQKNNNDNYIIDDKLYKNTLSEDDKRQILRKCKTIIKEYSENSIILSREEALIVVNAINVATIDEYEQEFIRLGKNIKSYRESSNKDIFDYMKFILKDIKSPYKNRVVNKKVSKKNSLCSDEQTLKHMGVVSWEELEKKLGN